MSAGLTNLARLVVLRSGVPTEVIPVTEGRITVEAQRTPRRTLDATVLGDQRWVPTKWWQPLDSRSGVEVRADMGLFDPTTGEELWWPLGVFTVRTANVKTTPEGTSIDITGTDRSMARSWPLEGGVAVGTATPLEDAIEKVLASTRTPVTVPGSSLTQYTARAEWVKSPTGYNLPAAILGKLGDNSWQVCYELAASVGFDLAFDAHGFGRLTKILDPATTEPKFVWQAVEQFAPPAENASHLDVGETSAAVVSQALLSQINQVTRDLNGDEMVDGIILKWAGGKVIYPNEFCRFPAMWEGDESMILSAKMATEAAKADYLKRIGQVEQVTFTALVDPRCEVNDIARVIDPNSGTDIVGRIIGLGYGFGNPTMEVRLATRNFDRGQ